VGEFRPTPWTARPLRLAINWNNLNIFFILYWGDIIAVHVKIILKFLIVRSRQHMIMRPTFQASSAVTFLNTLHLAYLQLSIISHGIT
jgi:hypothetical protein